MINLFKTKKLLAKKTDKVSNGADEGSLTVEAALVLPLFLYFMIAFLYFIQVFTVQEQIQASITKMGLNLSKTAYIFKEFPDIKEYLSFDFTIFGEEYDFGLDELSDNIASGSILKQYAKKYLDTDQINKSCIKNGFDGLNFYRSSLINGGDYIDIIVSYNIEIPIKIFIINDMQMTQRVRLRCWTGYEVAAAYQIEEDKNETMVYVTETGKVYHKSESCTYIRLSIIEVQGIPTALRNENGSKYTPCEICCKGALDSTGAFYITTYGTKYHSNRTCKSIKRNVKEIQISEIGERTPCKKCYGD